MSAFIVSEKHINAIVNLATQYGKEITAVYDDAGIRHEYDATMLGKELSKANVMSVNTRYPQDKEDLPFVYKFKTDLHWSGRAVEALKLCDCLEYQSCEWETSRAKKLLDACRSRIIKKLPGYTDAKWGL